MLVETLNYNLAAHLWFDTSLFDGKVDLPLVFLGLLFLRLIQDLWRWLRQQ